jgi:hypothetical protein
MLIQTQRNSGNPETSIDFRQIEAQGLINYVVSVNLTHCPAG